MDDKRRIDFLIPKNTKGQSTVEYILLLAVVIALFSSVYRSKAFQDFLGEDSEFFNTIAERLALDYRYARRIDISEDIDEIPNSGHPSFVEGNQSRFFGSIEEYGN